MVALHLCECFQWDIDGKKREIHNTNLSTLAITVEICIQKIILNDHLGEEKKTKIVFCATQQINKTQKKTQTRIYGK